MAPDSRLSMAACERGRTPTSANHSRKTIIIIIIIIAEMAVFNVAGYLVEERRGRPVITASGDNIPNKFRI